MTNQLIHPVFFAPNRVWREYPGGMLLTEFLDRQPGQDDSYSEDWLASVEPADAPGGPGDAAEGLGRVLDPHGQAGPTFAELLSSHTESLLGMEHTLVYGAELGFAARLSDPAGPMVPDGLHRAEGWYVIKTRGETATLGLGLAEGVSAEDYDRLAGQNPAAAVEMLRPVEVHAGEGFFLPAGLRRGVKTGALLLRAWATSAGPEVGCLPEPEEGYTPAEMHLNRRSDEGQIGTLVDAVLTDGWSMDRLEILGRMQYKPARPFALLVCLDGEGRMAWPAGSVELGPGRVFLQPFGVPWLEFAAYGRVSLLSLLPPNTLSEPL